MRFARLDSSGREISSETEAAPDRSSVIARAAPPSTVVGDAQRGAPTFYAFPSIIRSDTVHYVEESLKSFASHKLPRGNTYCQSLIVTIMAFYRISI